MADSNYRIDVGLAKVARSVNCLEHRELTGRQVGIPDMAGEQAVSALAGTVQKVDGRRKRRGRPCHRSKSSGAPDAISGALALQWKTPNRCKRIITKIGTPANHKMISR